MTRFFNIETVPLKLSKKREAIAGGAQTIIKLTYKNGDEKTECILESQPISEPEAEAFVKDIVKALRLREYSLSHSLGQRAVK